MSAEAACAEPSLAEAESLMMRMAAHESPMVSEGAVESPVVSEATLGSPMMSEVVREPLRAVWKHGGLTDSSVRLANGSSSGSDPRSESPRGVESIVKLQRLPFYEGLAAA